MKRYKQLAKVSRVYREERSYFPKFGPAIRTPSNSNAVAPGNKIKRRQVLSMQGTSQDRKTSKRTVRETRKRSADACKTISTACKTITPSHL
jgi:hypothetical protein